MQTTRVPKRQVSSDAIAKYLDSNGWTKATAGDIDFNKAVSAIKMMYETGRGLFLTGNAGCGKTHLMKLVKKMLGLDGYAWYYCKEKEDMFALRGNQGEALEGSVILDDIGAEEIIREFGNTIDIVGDFIQIYHYRGKGRFLATTNLDSNAINSRYGGRILDRILEMCVVVKFEGKSKRERIIF